MGGRARVDLVEAALAERPGRVDLAVEIPRPDAEARRRLIDLYARGLPFSPGALERTTERTEGATASFFKELFRRVVLTAADLDVPIDDALLDSVRDEMRADSERLTQVLLGLRSDDADAHAAIPSGR